MTLAVMVGMSGAIAPAIQAAEPASEIQQSIALEPTRQGNASNPIGQETWVNRLSETLLTSDNTRSSAFILKIPEKKSDYLPIRKDNFQGQIAGARDSDSADADAASITSPTFSVALPNSATTDFLKAKNSPASPLLSTTAPSSTNALTVSSAVDISPDKGVFGSMNLAENSSTLPLLQATALKATKKFNSPNLALLSANISYSAADLQNERVADSPPATPGRPVPSRALNLWSLRSLKKPVGARVLDTGVDTAGIQPRDTSESFWTRDFLTGNWGGERDRLYQHGVDITLAQFLEGYANVSGGKERASAYNGVSVISFDFDTKRLGLWPEGQVHLTTTWLQGETSVGRNFSGALNSVYFADPPRKGYRLFEFWYGQKLFDGKLEVRLGKIYPFVKIGISQPAAMFTNASFAYPAFIGTTSQYGYSTAYATAPFGMQFLYNPTPKWFVFANVADGFDDPSGGFDNFRGLSVGLSSKEGVEGIVELGHKLNQEKGSTGLPGTYRLGFQFHTGRFKDNHTNQNGDSLAIAGGEGKSHRGNEAFYVMAEQMLFRESPDPTDRRQGLTGFLKSVIVPSGDVNSISLNVAGGLEYEGLIHGRDRDVLGLGVSYTKISEGLREYNRDLRRLNPNTVVPDGETVVELLYAAEIAPWWVLIGSLQRIIHPNGSSTNPDATVIGISSRFAF